jgi:hypothetical protein
MPGDFRGTLFHKNWMGDYLLAEEEQLTCYNIYISVTLKKILSAYM